jgi:hypothetical protein
MLICWSCTRFKAVNLTLCIADIDISQKESRIQNVVYDSLTLN